MYCAPEAGHRRRLWAAGQEGLFAEGLEVAEKGLR